MAGQGAAYERADIEFDAEGATLRGWLYRPQSGASFSSNGVTSGTNTPRGLRSLAMTDETSERPPRDRGRR